MEVYELPQWNYFKGELISGFAFYACFPSYLEFLSSLLWTGSKVCVDQLPKTVMGEDFIKRFVDLEDSIITIFSK